MSELETKSNWDVFYETIESLAGSQGFYSRLYSTIQSWDADELKEKIDIVNNLDVKFKEPVDVILYLEG
jgi:hypothetical protein